MKALYLIILCLLILQNSFSQNFTRPNDWKKYRQEIIVQVGVSQFLGDLGGLNSTGTDYSPADIEFAATKPSLSFAYRYKLAKNFNIHSSLNYLLVAGDDKLTAEKFRNNRNLNFKSNIFELAARAELSFFYSNAGHRYGLKNTLGSRHKSKSNELIGFIGLGVFYFNPKGKDPNTGSYVKLYPLHTEGQGLPGGPKQYKRISISIPMGVAWRMSVTKLLNVGIEFNYRKTFTDYIDDVSTTYYFDRAAQVDAYGPQSLALSDPSLGDIPGASFPNGDGTGAQRGDKENDSFMSMQIKVGYFLSPKRKKTRLRSKF